jgi:monothiol glutaredoxin
MSISEATREKIESLISQDKVVLFMKGTPEQPQCGFSATTISMLGGILDQYATFNVLEDHEIREGIKEYSDWPTIPQLYIDKELVGGCDIVTSMFNSGELHDMLGADRPDRTPPEITISDDAAEQFRQAMDGHENIAVHFSIDGNWQSQFELGPAKGHEISTEANGIQVLMDPNSAQRAKGAHIAWSDSLQGQGLSIHLPEAPPPVKTLEVTDLKKRLASEPGSLFLDVRNDSEREKAAIDGFQPLTQEIMHQMDDLPHDTPLVFLCHVGSSSMGAAEHFRKQGFTDISNVTGGINAWSLEIDPDVPAY